MSVPLLAASIATLAWLAFAVLEFHETVKTDGSWYNHLRLSDDREDTYRERLRVTVNERIAMGKAVLYVTGIAIVIFILVYVFVTGLIVLV